MWGRLVTCGRLEIGLVKDREIRNRPISNRPQDAILMPHTFPITELNPWGGSPDPRRAPSPGLSKIQRDPNGRRGGRLRTRGIRPTKVCGIRMASCGRLLIGPHRLKPVPPGCTDFTLCKGPLVVLVFFAA